MYFFNTLGILTEPSSFWLFSRRAIISLPTARPDPFKVWGKKILLLDLSLTLSFILLDWKDLQLEQLETSLNLSWPGIQTSKSSVKDDEKPKSPEHSLTIW